jgi:peptidoglycan LD-endopeptidase CwlK
MSKSFKKFLVLFFIPAAFLSTANSVINNKLFSVRNNKGNIQDSIKVFTDSNVSLDEALSGIDIPPRIKSLLTIVNVYYYSFDGRLHRGQIVINKYLAKDIEDIFSLIKERKFPVKKVVPVFKYNWNDIASMEDNNTSAFNYRIVKGTKKLSEHAKGRAIDINPGQNPQVKNGLITPKGSLYRINLPGTISDTSFIVKFFLGKGWRWGGDWKHLKDYQHFEKH